MRRYERRTARVDEAILGVYLSGANTRRIKGALTPLLPGGPLSKDAVSRLVGRLKEEFEAWRERDLAAEQVRYLLLDGWYPKVRIGRHRVRVAVLVTLGVCADGRRIVLDLRLVGEETSAGWQAVVTSLVKRHVGVPALAIIDGNPGLHQALRAEWPQLPTCLPRRAPVCVRKRTGRRRRQVQRCTVHKLRNLQAKVPAALREEVAEDYHQMIYATTAAEVEQERKRFRTKWHKRCAAVVSSLDEAGEELFTFLGFPSSQGRALRTTNALERINEEFRRRTKTQGSLPNEEAVLYLLFGLLRSGQVKLRRLDGYHDMPKSTAAVSERKAA